jgi:4-amino-4-deoxy-L-arabinose transferase-like glycosyltransferase
VDTLNTKKVATALFLAVLFILAAAQIWCRPVDRDEGFWLYTSWRLAEGELPYRDFALPHLPLAPLYYAAAVKLFGPSLYALRAMNVAFFAASALALGLAAGRRFGAREGVLAVTLFASSSLALTWLVPIKAYAPASAALAFAVAVWLWPGKHNKIGFARAVVVGILIGAATLARLPLLVTLAAAAIGIWFAAPGRQGRRLALVAATCAGALAVTPLAAYFRLAAGEAFTFNVWGIHELFLTGEATHRGAAALRLLLPPDPAILILLALLALGTGYRRILAFPLAAGLLVVAANLVPGSAQGQYFTPAVAAFAPAAGVGAAWMWRKRRKLALGVVAVAVVVGAARPAAKVAFDRAHKTLVGPAEVYAAARLVAERTPADARVFTAWPGYAALARREVIPGWELGYFTDRVGERLDPRERRRYHFMTYEETAAALAAGEAAYALDGLDTPTELEPTLGRYFRLVSSRRGVTLLRYAPPN